MKHVIAIVLGYAIGTICGLVGSQMSRDRATRYEDDVRALLRKEATTENRDAVVDLMRKAQDNHVSAAVALSACASIGAFIGAVAAVLLDGKKPRWLEELEPEDPEPGRHRKHSHKK